MKLVIVDKFDSLVLLGFDKTFEGPTTRVSFENVLSLLFQ